MPIDLIKTIRESISKPEILFAPVSPVIMAFFLAFGDGVHNFTAFFICLFLAVFLYLGSSFAFLLFKTINDETEFSRQNGLKILLLAFFAAATALSMPCVLKGGLPFALFFISAVFFGIFFGAGKRPIASTVWGDILIFLFAGPLTTAAVYYLQSLEINIAIFLAGFGPGLLTLAAKEIKTAKGFERQYSIQFLIFAAMLFPVLIYSIIKDHLPVLITTGSLLFVPFILVNLYSAERKERGEMLSFYLIILYTGLLSLGWGWEVFGYYLRHLPRLLNV